MSRATEQKLRSSRNLADHIERFLRTDNSDRSCRYELFFPIVSLSVRIPGNPNIEVVSESQSPAMVPWQVRVDGRDAWITQSTEISRQLAGLVNELGPSAGRLNEAYWKDGLFKDRKAWRNVRLPELDRILQDGARPEDRNQEELCDHPLEPKVRQASKSVNALMIYACPPPYKWGIINRQGNLIVKTIYDEVGVYSDGLVWARYGNRYGYFDERGKLAIPFRDYKTISEFHDACAIVQCADGHWKRMNKNGAFLASLNFDAIGPFVEGLAPACQNGQWGYVDVKGNFVLKPLYGQASPFKNGFGSVQLDGKFALVDKKGRLVTQFSAARIPARIDSAERASRLDATSEAPSVLVGEGRLGYVDRNGKILVTPRFSKAMPFKDGFAQVAVLNPAYGLGD